MNSAITPKDVIGNRRDFGLDKNSGMKTAVCW